jgi:plasmid stabilization system protein ParE
MANFPVFMSGRAKREAQAALAQWDTQHPTQAGQFLTELRNSIEALERFPELGRASQQKGVRLLLLVRTGYHVYYRWNGSRVDVLSIWQATRRPPKL